MRTYYFNAGQLERLAYTELQTFQVSSNINPGIANKLLYIVRHFSNHVSCQQLLSDKYEISQMHIKIQKHKMRRYLSQRPTLLTSRIIYSISLTLILAQLFGIAICCEFFDMSFLMQRRAQKVISFVRHDIHHGTRLWIHRCMLHICHWG